MKYFNKINIDTYEFLLFGEIGEQIDGNAIASEIKYISEKNEVKHIILRINSVGGNIINGFSLVSAITNSDKNIKTICEGLAGSMAGIIFSVGKTREMKDYSKIMIHSPMIPDVDDEDLTNNDKNALNALGDSLLTILANNSNLTKAQLKKLMQDETWLSAEEAKKIGLCDKIIYTKRSDLVKQPTKNNLLELVSNYTKIYNNLNFNNMDVKNITEHLKLNDGVNENQILNSIKKIETDLSSYKNKYNESMKLNEELKNKISQTDILLSEQKNKILELNNIILELQKSEKETLIDLAINEGKYKLEDKDNLLEIFSNIDIKIIKNIIDKISTQSTTLNSVLKPEKKEIKEDRSMWTYKDWCEKDPVGLSQKDAKFINNLK